MNLQNLKEIACRRIDEHKNEIISIGEDIRIHPELGFKEHRTAGIVSSCFQQMGIRHESGLAVTGIKGVLPGRKSLLTVAYMGELDSVLVRDHPDADPRTGAAHACGHNAQIANLIALAFGLSDVMESLDGNVALMAVPAEEYVEVAYRLELKEQGTIQFLGGKPELIRTGVLDDVDVAIMTHQSTSDKPGSVGVAGPSNGCLVKQIEFLGRAAHAGGAPHKGINALKAANLALQAIDANRETFLDDDHIRIHPIITKGGELVNVIPADVRMETYVRGASVEAIRGAADKVDRCLKAGALAMDGRVRIHTLPGYLPRLLHCELMEIYKANACALVGEDEWVKPEFGAGSTDMGDVSHIMPAIEAQARGCGGTGHGADFRIEDPNLAYITPAKIAAMTIIDLLVSGASEGKKILEEFQPAMNKNQYLDFMMDLEKHVHWPDEKS